MIDRACRICGYKNAGWYILCSACLYKLLLGKETKMKTFLAKLAMTPFIALFIWGVGQMLRQATARDWMVYGACALFWFGSMYLLIGGSNE
jgi:hypothetical protein